jgi:hypothetical protein
MARSRNLLLVSGTALAAGLTVLWLIPMEPIALHSLTPVAQQQFYMRFFKPRLVDIARVPKEEAVRLAQQADPEGGAVEEVVLAHAHRVDSGPTGDPLCWVVVMTFDQKPPVTSGFVLVLVDAHSGKVILQGGLMSHR